MNADETIQPVVVGFDPGDGDDAFDWARTEAERRNLPLELVVAEGALYAAAPGFGATSPWPAGLTIAMRDEARDYARAHAAGVNLSVKASVGTPAAVLVAASRDAELVVVGRRSHSVTGELLGGSTSAQVVAHASCPVVIVDRTVAGMANTPIVVGVDGSAESKSALGFAFHRASALDAPIVAVHGWWIDVPGAQGVEWLSEGMRDEMESAAQAVLDHAVAPWAEKFPEVVVSKVLSGLYPRDALLGQAAGAQLIVVGSRGHGGFVGLLLGSVSQSLLHDHDRPCPLAVLHGEKSQFGS